MSTGVTLDFNNFAYSRLSHINIFKEFFEEQIRLFRVNFSKNTSLKEYQDLLVLFFIYNIIPKGSKILGIGISSKDVLNILKQDYECYLIKNSEDLIHDLIKSPELISYENISYLGSNISFKREYFDFIFSNSVFDEVKFPNPILNYSNIIFNLLLMSKSGGIINVNFNVSLFKGKEKINNLLFGFYKDYFKSYQPLINYVNPFCIKSDDELLEFKYKEKVAKVDYLQEKNQSGYYSYNVLIRKNYFSIDSKTVLTPTDYLKNRPAYFFHHLIKCGGSSLGVILKQWFHFHNDLYQRVDDDFDYFQELNVFRKYKFNLEFLSSDYCIRGHFQHEGIFLHQRYPEIFKKNSKIRVFTFVRDPFRMLVSLYYFSRNKDYGFQNLSLINYLNGTQNMLSKIIPCDESNYKEVLDKYFFIGIVENIQGSFDKLASLTGFKKIIVPRLNTSEKDSQFDKLTPEFIAKIKKLNELDYKIYNYCLEKFNSYL